MTPDSPAMPRMLAPHHMRLFALIVDYLLVVIALKLGHQALLGPGWDLEPHLASEGTPGWAWVALLLLLGVFKDAVRGRSPGKWLTGLAVMRAADPSQGPLFLGRILRNVPLILLPVEALLVLTDRHGRRMGDRLAGTVVVVPPHVSPPARRLLVLAIGFLASLLMAFGITAWNLRQSDAYRTAVRIASGHPLVTGIVGTPVAFGFSPEMEMSFPPPEGKPLPGKDSTVDPGIGQGRAVILLDAEGPEGEARVRVVLRLMEAPRRWEEAALERVYDKGSEPLESSPAPPRR